MKGVIKVEKIVICGEIFTSSVEKAQDPKNTTKLKLKKYNKKRQDPKNTTKLKIQKCNYLVFDIYDRIAVVTIAFLKFQIRNVWSQ